MIVLAPAFSFIPAKQKGASFNLLLIGGRGWIRTTEVTDDRFTVCSLWPLGNSPIFTFKKWSWWTDSNPRPADYKSAALPAELHQHLNARIIYHKSSVESSPKSKKIEKIVYFPLLSSSVMTAVEFFAARAVNFE